MRNLWDEVSSHLGGELRRKLYCIMKADCLRNCIDLTDAKYDILCDTDRCKVEYVLKKFCNINCKCENVVMPFAGIPDFIGDATIDVSLAGAPSAGGNIPALIGLSSVNGASGLYVNFPLPAGLTIVSSDGGLGTYNATTGNFGPINLGVANFLFFNVVLSNTLPAGTSVTLTGTLNDAAASTESETFSLI